MKFSSLFLLFVAFHSTTEAVNLSGIGKSMIDIWKGLLQNIPNSIISTRDIFETGKNVIAGYPFNRVS